jgi:threonine dehydrogenase-like Zn-dependent dehydrogenase
VSAGVKKGDTVAVAGDGAVGLCAVLAARRLGAERIIALSRHADRQKIAREFQRGGAFLLWLVGYAQVLASRGTERDLGVAW